VGEQGGASGGPVAGERAGMFTWLKRRKLEKLYRRLLEQARDLQRKGDIEGFAAKTAEAEVVGDQLEALQSQG